MKVGIIGAGTMGSGIAQAFAQTEGYEVFLCDINEEFAANGKKKIAKGFEKFVESYRAKEKEKYTFTIDDCTLTCGEDDLAEAEKKLDAHYDKNKLRDTFKDKFVLIYSVMCAASVVLLLVLLAYFSPVILTIAILVGLAGSFLLWRRIVDMGKILKEKKRKGKLLLKQALDELTQWRKAYKEADAQSADMLNAIASF
mgnify:CR=1 FL=1